MPFVFQIGAGASQDRLEKLIALRLQAGVDKDEIDTRIWDLFGETWSIMFTDLSGFSRRSAKFGIIHFLQIIYESQRLLVPVIDKFDGILLKMDGDSMMVLFRKPVKAVECAIDMQRTLKNYNSARPDEEKYCCALESAMARCYSSETMFSAHKSMPLRSLARIPPRHVKFW